MGEPVRLTIVRDAGEAEVLCGLLRTEGIPCIYRVTDQSAELQYGAWREVLVNEADLTRARELLPAEE